MENRIFKIGMITFLCAFGTGLVYTGIQVERRITEENNKKYIDCIRFRRSSLEVRCKECAYLLEGQQQQTKMPKSAK
jgi:hypothetical protein